MTKTGETIAAIATPPGIGGVCIIRISGQNALSIGKKISNCEHLKPRHAHFATFRTPNNEIIDQGLLITFPAPHSFTGEDVVELHGHGGIAVANALLNSVLQYNARLAEAGEFTRRAFLNDKLDLTQAEAVADLIAARSQSAMRAANRSLQGKFSEQINILAEEILQLRVYIEAALDFPEEDIDFISEANIENRLQQWGERLNTLLENTQQGKLLNDGINMVLVGKPNAGKSSLLNALSGENTAIVTDIPGTTRDIVREQLIIAGMPVNILDTAGLRESTDIIEQEGIRRSREAIKQADIIALLIAGDALEHDDEILLNELQNTAPETPILRLYNKMDLVSKEVQDTHQDGIWLSAKQGLGLEVVRNEIAHLAGKQDKEAPFIARERHVQALKRAKTHYKNGAAQLQSYRAGELLAEDLRAAHDALGEITGKIHADALLGEIFSGFCIGK